MNASHEIDDHRVDATDELLAEYFRWVDGGGAANADAFLSSLARPLDDHRLVQSLRDYLRDADAVQRLAADTTSLWLESESPQTLPRERTAAALQLPASLGDYELLEEIARGGMGVVYKARQKRPNRTVCVKMILLGELAAEREIERFLAEAEAAASLHHPNIVTIYEVGLDKGNYFFSMEYVPGSSLADRVARGPLESRDAARYVRTIARAVHYAHENNVLHRDLKPSNVVLDEFDQPRVTDFGLAKRVGAGSLTATGALVGSPSYMAPEQTRGEARLLDVTCDVYGLGAILYELMAARPPFRGATPLDTLWQVREHEPVRPSLVNPHADRDLETICLKCLEKVPQRRYPTALAVAEELERFVSGVPIHARPAGVVRKSVRWIRRSPLAATVGVALAIVAATSAWAYLTTASSLRQVQESHGEQARLLEQVSAAQEEAQNHLYLATIHMARQALRDGEIDRLDELLQRARPAAIGQGRRGWEWYYLSAVAHQELASFGGHGATTEIAWSPDGERIAAIGDDRSLRILDGHTGQVVHSWSTSDGAASATGVPCIAWCGSTDRIAVAGSDGVVSIWEPQSGRLLHRLGQDKTPILAVDWDPEGLRIATCGEDGSVQIWDGASGQPLMRLAGHAQRAGRVRFSPDGIRLASAGDDGTIRIYRGDDGEVLFTIAAHDGWTNDVAWSPDGHRLVSVSQDGELKVWRLPSHADARADEVVQLWDRASMNRRGMTDVAWSPDGERLVTAGADPWLTMWDADSGDVLGRLFGHRGPVRSVAWHPDGRRIASASEDGTVKFWDGDFEAQGLPRAGRRAPIRTVAWSPDGKWLAQRDVDDVVVAREFDAVVSGDLGKEEKLLPREPIEIGSGQALAWHPNRASMAIAMGETVALVDFPSRRERIYFEGHTSRIWTLAFAPTGERLAAGSNDGTVIVWDARGGEAAYTLKDHRGDIRAVCFSHDGEVLATADADGAVRIFRADDGQLQRSFAVATAAVNSLAFSPDDHTLAVSTHEGTIESRDVQTGKLLRTLPGHRGPAWSAVWTPDGRRLASCGQDGMIRIWDAATGEEVLQLEGHAGPVWSIDWNPDGCRLLSASADETVRLWDASRGYGTSR
jgi:WD40 repeat protein/tRNA A-37 threonylcarbamoyl transferase component Bud32